jgi:nicotinamide riboside kinase
MQLAQHFETKWVEEYARIYLENLGREYNEDDLLEIAKGQLDLENGMEMNANRFLFYDTDLHVIKVWSEFKYGHCYPFILEQLSIKSYDGYIITSPDFPWQPDPLREHPDQSLRDYFFSIYCDLIKATQQPFVIVKGTESQRLETAIDFVNSF